MKDVARLSKEEHWWKQLPLGLTGSNVGEFGGGGTGVQGPQGDNGLNSRMRT